MRIREENKIELTKEPPLYNLRPAADITFKDAGEIFGKNTIAVVLTGMGSDGAEGASLIKEKGGCVIAQDEKTSVVYGMPRAVVERGVADYILPVDKILDKIVEIVEKD
jgi:two-component system chemotaxis response regulator CheB